MVILILLILFLTILTCQEKEVSREIMKENETKNINELLQAGGIGDGHQK